MKLILEGREYEMKANGYFMKKYQDTFPNETFMNAISNVLVKRDLYSCAKLIYCGINEEQPFEEWLNSFESPIFCLDSMANVGEYLTRAITPTIESKEKEVKKKTIA